MADTAGMAEIRGIDINKLVEGFRDVDIILKKYVRVIATTAREIRWYSKTAGYLTSPTTTGITTDLIETAYNAMPVVIENSYTRNTSYVKKFFASSPMLSIEDLKDSDPDIWGDIIKDAVRAVNKKVDARLLTVLDAAGCQTAAATGNGWNVDADADPMLDFLAAIEAIENYGYSSQDLIAYMNPAEKKWLLRWLITVKGSSIPGFSSSKVEGGELMQFLGVRIVSDPNRPTDTVTFFSPSAAVIWREFMPTTSAVIDEPGIGKTVRVWCEGEAIRPNPNAVFKLTDTIN
ncbi:MAG: hypothetical protein WC479_09980 [Candidatus Izemoplasmatales bacterium]|jgi:hypothetical protein